MHPHDLAAWDAEASDSLDILAICFENTGAQATEQANRLRPPHNLGANGRMSYPWRLLAGVLKQAPRS
eukprot:1091713-Pyramimonas_sp.AAC.1